MVLKERIISGVIIILAIVISLQFKLIFYALLLCNSFKISKIQLDVSYNGINEYELIMSQILKVNQSEVEIKYIEYINKPFVQYKFAHILIFQKIIFIPIFAFLTSAFIIKNENLFQITEFSCIILLITFRLIQFVSFINFIQNKYQMKYYLLKFLIQNRFKVKRIMCITFLQICGDVLGYLIFFFPLAYIGYLMNFVQGRTYVILWLISVFQADNGALFFGSLLGKNKFCVIISPNKSWEGIMGAFLLCIITVLLYGQLFDVPTMSKRDLLFISFYISFTSVFGDIFESFIKRCAKVKDAGNVLPGQGGLLDRVINLKWPFIKYINLQLDSLSLSVYIIFYYVKLFIKFENLSLT